MSEERYGATGAGTVVLEIGAGTGALVLRAPADLAGREIEISPAHEPARRRHTCVRERHGADGIGYAAVYDRLPPAGTQSGTTAPPPPRPSRSWAARSPPMTGLRAPPPGPAERRPSACGRPFGVTDEGMLSGAADPRAGDGAFAGR
jgi:hypothetical protein